MLDLRNVLSVTNGTGISDAIFVEALAGGLVDLRATVQMVDPNAGDTRYRQVVVTADGVNSRVDLSSLVSMTDAWGGSLGGHNLWSQLIARNHGTIHVPILTDLSAVALSLNGTGTLPIAQITSIRDGAILVTDGTHTFTGLTNASGSMITLSNGGRMVADALSNINGASITVGGGVTLSLPSVPSYTHTSGDQDYNRLRAEGAGSVLDLRNMTSITNGQGNNERIFIEAINGDLVVSHARVAACR